MPRGVKASPRAWEANGLQECQRRSWQSKASSGLGLPNASSHTVNSPPIKNVSVSFPEIDHTFNQALLRYRVALKGRDNKEIILLKE